MTGVVDGLNGNGDRAEASGWDPRLRPRGVAARERLPASAARARTRGGQRVARAPSCAGFRQRRFYPPAFALAADLTTRASSIASRNAWFFVGRLQDALVLFLRRRQLGACGIEHHRKNDGRIRTLRPAAHGRLSATSTRTRSHPPRPNALSNASALRDHGRPIADLAECGVKGDVGKRPGQVQRGIRVNENRRGCADGAGAGNGYRDCPSGISRRRRAEGCASPVPARRRNVAATTRIFMLAPG